MKILVVDDEYVSLTKMISILEPYGMCHAATNGPQAIQMVTEAIGIGAPYGLITLDIEMPCLSGLEVLKTIRLREQLRQVKPPARIIMATAASRRENVRDAVELSCDAFLVKPVSRANLVTTLEKLGIAAPQQAAAETTDG